MKWILIGTLTLGLGGGIYWYFGKGAQPVSEKEQVRQEYVERAQQTQANVKAAKAREAKNRNSPQEQARSDEKFLDCPAVTSMLTPSFKKKVLSWNTLLRELKSISGEGLKVQKLNAFRATHGLPLPGWQGRGTWVSERHPCGALYINFYKEVAFGDFVFEAVKGKATNKWNKPAERPLADISNDQIFVRYKVKPLCLNECDDCVKPFDVGLNINRGGALRVVNNPAKGRVVPADLCPVKPKDNRPVLCYEHEPTGRLLVTTEACR